MSDQHYDPAEHHDDGGHLALSPDDQRVLDRLVEAGFELSAAGLTGEDLVRGEKLMSLYGMLEDYPVDDPDQTLIDATLARIDQHERQLAHRMSIETAHEAGPRRLRVPDLISWAAIVLIVASVAIPVMHQLRTRSIRTQCGNNMRLVGYAFSNYANDWNDELPMVQAGLQNTWTSVFRNAVNFRPLVEGGYCDRGHLACPGHDGPGDAFSYQFRSPGLRTSWNSGRAHLVLGDRNPLMDGLQAGDDIAATAISANHGGRGQNVLSNDGKVFWLEDPILVDDNIWLPRGVERLEDGVAPGENDVFLAN